MKAVKAPDRFILRRKILIADEDSVFAKRLAELLWERGFQARITSRVSIAKEIMEFWHPDVVLVDMFLPETTAMSLLKFVQLRELKPRPRVVVMSKQNKADVIQKILKAGADHHILKPFSLEELMKKVEGAGTRESEIAPVAKQAANLNLHIRELHMLNLFIKQAMQAVESEAGLYNLMRMIHMRVEGIRCSMIHCVNIEKGVVMAASDDRNATGLGISLNKYPEIVEVVKTRETLLIPDSRTSEILAPVRSQMQNTPFISLALFPVAFPHSNFCGVLSLRMERKGPEQLFYVEKFGQVCAQILGMSVATGQQRMHG